MKKEKIKKLRKVFKSKENLYVIKDKTLNLTFVTNYDGVDHYLSTNNHEIKICLLNKSGKGKTIAVQEGIRDLNNKVDEIISKLPVNVCIDSDYEDDEKYLLTKVDHEHDTDDVDEESEEYLLSFAEANDDANDVL